MSGLMKLACLQYIQIPTHTDLYIHIHALSNQCRQGFLTRGSVHVQPSGDAPPTQISLEGASGGTYVLHLPTGYVFAATEMCFDPPPTRVLEQVRQNQSQAGSLNTSKMIWAHARGFTDSSQVDPASPGCFLRTWLCVD